MTKATDALRRDLMQLHRHYGRLAVKIVDDPSEALLHGSDACLVAGKLACALAAAIKLYEQRCGGAEALEFGLLMEGILYGEGDRDVNADITLEG